MYIFAWVFIQLAELYIFRVFFIVFVRIVYFSANLSVPIYARISLENIRFLAEIIVYISAGKMRNSTVYNRLNFSENMLFFVI
jgi:hypothetical protein